MLHTLKHRALLHSRLLSKYVTPFNSQKLFRSSFSFFYPYIIQQTGYYLDLTPNFEILITKSLNYFLFYFLNSFQRRPLPSSNAHSAQDSTDCMFPDLVSCTVPVEQILPSILTMSWSRGMGHLVRAQNIHTIGNLSALKEEQVMQTEPPEMHCVLVTASEKSYIGAFNQCATSSENKKSFS